MDKRLLKKLLYLFITLNIFPLGMGLAFENESSKCFNSLEKQRHYFNQVKGKIICHLSGNKNKCYKEIEKITLPSKLILGRKFVRSEVEFFHHTILHKKRVLALARAAYAHFPQLFNGVTEGGIQRVISKHDNAKINFNGDHSHYKKLYTFYGKKTDPKLIQIINILDNQIIKNALDFEHKSHKKTVKIILQKSYKNLERIADLVDRGMDTVSSEEFGRKMWKQSGVSKNNEYKKIAQYLEQNYLKIIAGLKYRKLKPREHSLYYKVLELNEIISRKSAFFKENREIINSITDYDSYYSFLDKGRVCESIKNYL